MKRLVYRIAVMVFAVCMVLGGSSTAFAEKQTRNDLKGCIVADCIHTRKGDSLYCSNHKCAVYDCTTRNTGSDKYCYTHRGTTVHKLRVNGVEVSRTTKSYGSTTQKSSGSTKSYSSSKKSTKSSSSRKSSKSSSSKKKSYYNSYDKGYEDIWLDDDYDEDRYRWDDDYANGVDDAMDDCDW